MEPSPKPTKPDFSTLTGIMDYFQKVPFEKFKSDLDNWFKTALEERQKCKLDNDTCQLPDGFEKFISDIYNLAENKDQQRLN